MCDQEKCIITFYISSIQLKVKTYAVLESWEIIVKLQIVLNL